jgi:septal ring factor EnvC (AmiA/AmiB activator)
MGYAKAWLACAAATAAFSVHGQVTGTVWKCVEADGRSHYTNIKKDTEGKNCTVVTKEVSVVPAAKPPAAAAAPPNFPKVERDTQKARDDGRRKILEDELAAEQQGLADAKAKLTEQESQRFGDEKNYQRMLDRLKPFQDEVERHERNIAALNKELANLK